jgi:hypothetical protein
MPRSILLPKLVALACAIPPLLATAGEPPKPPAAARGMPLVFHSNFETGSLENWNFTDPEAWRITNVNQHRVLDQFRASKYTPTVRSPLNIALLPGLDLADFVLDVQVRSTTRDYPHRDLCLFFGHQDASHYYYVHLGREADPNAHSIFLVNGAPRISIAQERSKGTPWTDGWHHVRLVRRLTEGLIQVYFDDMNNPIMVAHNSTFRHGRIGLGSFDDTGQFDDIAIWGLKAEGEIGR